MEEEIEIETNRVPLIFWRFRTENLAEASGQDTISTDRMDIYYFYIYYISHEFSIEI